MKSNGYFIKDCELSDVNSSLIGNKAFNLGYLYSKSDGKVNIPKFAVLRSPNHDLNKSIVNYVGGIEQYLRYPIIVRSSSNVEDSINSFAGLFDSYVCNNRHELIENVLLVVEGRNSLKIQKYCERVGISPDSIDVSVLLQEYKSAELSGVLFTKHPITGDDSIFYIEYAFKTSDSVTSGSDKPEVLIISKDRLCELEYPFLQLSNMARFIEQNFNYPVDIEWVVSDGLVWIVQTRRITS